MMKLQTTYLGLTLRSPLVVSALPISRSIDNLRQMEDAGAGAIVLYSLFEEQLRRDYERAAMPVSTQEMRLPGLVAYTEAITAAKQAVDIPIIASLNCKSLGNWSDYAEAIEAAGADALELNVYYIPDNMDQTSEQIEDMHITILKAVKNAVSIPVAMKLVPYFTNVARFARRLDQTGVDGLVLFNRFYQPDFDPQTLKVTRDPRMGAATDSCLPLYWIAQLCGYVRADLAAASGIYTATDVVKMLMAGARVVLLGSALLTEGIDYLRTLTDDLNRWLDENDYVSVARVQGLMRQYQNRESTSERTQYLQVVNAYSAD